MACINGCMAILLTRECTFTLPPDAYVALLTSNFRCTVGISHPKDLFGTWSFYLVAVLYDGLVLSIATAYLLKLGTAGAPA
jgi:hypothetical protein